MYALKFVINYIGDNWLFSCLSSPPNPSCVFLYCSLEKLDETAIIAAIDSKGHPLPYAVQFCSRRQRCWSYTENGQERGDNRQVYAIYVGTAHIERVTDRWKR